MGIWDWDPCPGLELSGFRLVALAFAIDLLFLLCFFFRQRKVDSAGDAQRQALSAEILKIDPKEEFPKWARLNRELNKIKAPRPFRLPFWVRAIRTWLPAAILIRKPICAFPERFWSPFARFASFGIAASPEGKRIVGFVFFWLMLTRSDAALDEFITKKPF
jgi:hypothetical protein